MRQMICIPVIAMMLVAGTSVFAQEGGDGAGELLKSRIDEVLDILENDELSESRKRERIEGIIDPVFDYDLMAMLSLGKKNWGKFSGDQRETFTKRFVSRLKESYFDKIVLYQGDSDAQVTHGEPRTSGNKVHVPVEVKAKGNTVEMLYKFYSSDDQWRIYDVEINGVSVVQSYRSQFNQFLSSGSVEDLLEELKSPDNLKNP